MNVEKSLEIIVDTNNRLIKEGYKKDQIAGELGYEGDHGSSWLSKKLRKAEKKGMDVLWPENVKGNSGGSRGSVRDTNMSKLTYSDIPSKELPVEELWAKRIDEFKRVKAHADGEDKIVIDVDDSKPVGLLAFGDEHIDNPGCNAEKLLSDIQLAESTEGVWGISIGDVLDLWVGYLSKLYSKHETTKNQGFKLLEDMVKRVPWMFMVRGNHDNFRESYGQNLLTDINNILEVNHEANIELNFKNNAKCNIHARHSYKGASMWNNVHGQVKYAKMRGEYDILLGGHTHSCGYNWLPIKDIQKNTYRVSHACQLGSYKQIDDYSKSGGFEETNITPSVMFIVDPTTNDPLNKVLYFPDVKAGAEYLTYLRNR